MPDDEPPSAKILIVDDEHDLGELLQEYLTTHGHRVMDILDGPGFYREVERRWPALVHGFIWTSGESSREARAAAFVEATAAPVIKKPFHLPEVLAVVESSLRREWGRGR